MAAGTLAIGTTGIASADAGGSPITGSLGIDSGGKYAHYKIANPTGSKITITLTYAPFNAGEAHRVGFSVWQKGTKINHGSGQATGLKDHVNSSSVTTTLTPAAGAPLLIKVFNYSSQEISYTLTLAGDTASVAPARHAPSTAATEFKGTASGVLEGVGGATSASYTIAAPTGSKITIAMSYSPFDAGEAHRVGFSVWQKGKRLLRETGQATGFKDHTNSSTPTGNVTPAAGEPLLIKVFNLTSAPIAYTLAVS